MRMQRQAAVLAVLQRMCMWNQLGQTHLSQRRCWGHETAPVIRCPSG